MRNLIATQRPHPCARKAAYLAAADKLVRARAAVREAEQEYHRVGFDPSVYERYLAAASHLNACDLAYRIAKRKAAA